MLDYRIKARRVDGHSGAATCKSAEIAFDIDPAGREDAFNPTELLLAALAGCMLKGIERATPLLHFALSGVSIDMHAVRQDVPPLLISIDYEIRVDTEESEHRLELLHRNTIKYGTISNTLALAVPIEGHMVRAGAAAAPAAG